MSCEYECGCEFECEFKTEDKKKTTTTTTTTNTVEKENDVFSLETPKRMLETLKTKIK